MSKLNRNWLDDFQANGSDGEANYQKRRVQRWNNNKQNSKPLIKKARSYSKNSLRKIIIKLISSPRMIARSLHRFYKSRFVLIYILSCILGVIVTGYISYRTVQPSTKTKISQKSTASDDLKLLYPDGADPSKYNLIIDQADNSLPPILSYSDSYQDAGLTVKQTKIDIKYLTDITAFEKYAKTQNYTDTVQTNKGVAYIVDSQSSAQQAVLLISGNVQLTIVSDKSLESYLWVKYIDNLK